MKVSLFVTCLADQVFPQAAIATTRLLRRLGCEVEFPRGQTCCGQPAYNTGYINEARASARCCRSAMAFGSGFIWSSGTVLGRHV